MEFVTTIASYAWLAVSYIGPFLLVIGVVVFVHEYGHFFVARRCGAGVKVFSLGVGPELFGVNDRHGTRWRLSAIPLGGYVRFVGDRNSAGAPDAALSDDERRLSLAGQPLPARAAIVTAGPMANFLFAILFFAGTAYFLGEARLIPRIERIQPGSAAELAGIRAGDIVKSVDGQTIAGFADIFPIVSMRPGETMTIVVERGGQDVSIAATPALKEVETPFGRQRLGLLGLGASSDPGDMRTTYPSLMQALVSGVAQSWSIVRRTADYIFRLIDGRASADQLSGPVRIAQVSNVTASFGLSALINLAAVLSVSLGLMNLLPVPVLDGGHLLFYGIEAARGKPLSRRAQELGMRIGLGLVLALTVFVTFNDIWRLAVS